MAELQVLGPVAVLGSEGVLDLGGPKQRRLLTALIVDANTVVPTERLMDLLWDGDLPDGARRGFKAYVARLRTALAADDADGLIVTHPSGYALEIDRERLDSTRFERLVDQARAELALGENETAASLVDEALAMWRGPAFGEFAYESWVEASAARLEATQIAAREIRVEALLGLGRHHEVLPEVDELVVRFPYRDSLRSQRMIALYRTGRQVDALREYQSYRQMLTDEVGVEPGPELADLEQRIVAQDPDLRAASPKTRKLRDYELGQRIGAGQFAVVYRGIQPSMGRDVAIKVIRPELADRPEFIHRFEAEAQLVAGLEHPHVVPLYDFWREPGGAYLVMRWLGGGSLAARIERDGSISVAAAVRLIEEVGGALTVAHRAGIVHRDIRPANLVFDDAGNAFLTDFGIAVRSLTTDPSPASDCAEWSPYIAPEEREPGRWSPRSDVYSLGTVLFEALVGEPVNGPSERWDPSPLRPDLSSALDEAVRRACSADPADRFHDMAAFVAAVRFASRASAVDPLDATWDLAAARDEFLTEELERVNPYKGLRAFGEGDSKDFHGRDELTARLVEQLGRSRFVAVVGPSGSGKSSLVRAGVVPDIRAEGAYVATMVPGARPFDELERAILPIASHSDSALMARLTATPDGMAHALRQTLPGGDQLLLVIDQFEELFTTTPIGVRERFLDGIGDLVADDTSPVRLIVTLRADFYDRPLQHQRIGPLVRDNTTAVTPLTTAELEAAVTGPARRVGIDFEPALVTDLVADAATNPGMLPLLQYALTELYTNRTGRVITAAEYQAMGRMSGTLATRADDLYSDVGERNQAAVHRLFTQLITPGEGTEDTRRRALVSELAGVPEVVLDVYTRARLLTFDRDPVTREPTVEVAHEALIREWPRLRHWVDEDRDGLRVLAHLTTSARTWAERGRDDDELYRGARLAAAVDLELDDSESLAPLATEFLEHSVAAADAESRNLRRTTRRLRGLLVVAGGGLVIALVAGLIAVSRGREASDRAHQAELESLLSASGAALDTDEQLATLLALEARRLTIGHSDAADQALLSALTRDSRRIARIPLRSGVVRELNVSGDGTTLAASTGSSVEIIDLAGLAYVGDVFDDVPESRNASLQRLAINSDGSMVAALRCRELECELSAPGASTLTPGEHENVISQLTYLDVATGDSQPAEMPLGTPMSAMFSPTDDVLVSHWSNLRESRMIIRRSGGWTDLGDGFIPFSFSGDGQWLAMSPHPSAAPDVIVVSSADPMDTDEWRTVDMSRVEADDRRAALGRRLRGHLDATGARFVVEWSGGISIHEVGAESGTQGEPAIVLVPEGVRDVAVGPNDAVALADLTGSVRMYALETDSRRNVGVGDPLGRPYRARPGTNGVLIDFLPDGTLVTGGQVISLWTTDGSSVLGSTGLVGDYGAKFSPDGSLIAATDRLGRLRLQELSSGRLLAEIGIPRNGHGVPATPMVFTDDGDVLVVVGGRGSESLSGTWPFTFGIGYIELVDTTTGALIGDPVVLANGPVPTAVALSPDQTELAVGYRTGRVELRPFPGLEPVEIFDDFHATAIFAGDNRISGLAFTDDGSSLVALNDQGAIASWSMGRGAREWELDASGNRQALTLAGDGVMVTSSTDGTLTLADVHDPHSIRGQLFGHAGEVRTMAASGDLLASGSQVEGRIRLWDLETLEPYGRPIAVTGAFVDVSRDGQMLAVADGGYVGIWSLDPTDWADAACNVVGRNLTHDEWDRYLPSDEPYHVTCPQWI